MTNESKSFYVPFLGTEVFGPFSNDEDMALFAQQQIGHDIISIHASKEDAQKEADENKRLQAIDDEQLEPVAAHYSK